MFDILAAKGARQQKPENAKASSGAFDYVKYRKEYYSKNKEKLKQYYEENKDDINERNKTYYQNNRVEIREKQRKYFHEYYLKNKEKIKTNVNNRYYQYCNENNILVKKRKQTSNEILDDNIIISLNSD